MSEIVLNLVLAAVALAVMVSMWRFHKSTRYQSFNLLDLITTHDGKVSRPAVMEFGAWIMMTWAFIVLVQRDKLAEWYAGIYVGAFVIRAAHSAWLSCKNGGANSKQGTEAKG